MRIFQRYLWSRSVLLLFLALTVGRAGVAADTSLPSGVSNTVKQVRPPAWATPLSVNGLPNFFKIDDGFYRGAQPSAAGMKELKKMGIKTVVNLRAFHDDADILKDTGLTYVRIEFKTWHPEVEDIVRLLSIVTDSNKTPVFVHCQHGADRTGTMCAVYRIVVCGWNKKDAIEEMTRGGYGFHALWSNLIKFIQELDVEGIRKDFQRKHDMVNVVDK